MKGQSVSFDWVVGLAIFLLAVAWSTLVLTEQNDITIDNSIERKADLLTEDLSDDLTTELRQSPLILRQPYQVGMIPIDTYYRFKDIESAYIDTATWTNISGNHLVAVVDSGNNSYKLTMFNSNINHEYDTEILAGNTLRNGKVKLKPESGGISSLKLQGKEFLSGSFDLGETGDDVKNFGVYASAFGRVKMYNNSQEIILENPNTTIEFRNLTKLYWANDQTTHTLDTIKTYRDEETQGFTLSDINGEDYAVTFTGELDAEVYKDNINTVKVDLKSNRSRIFLHKNGLSQGKKRIRNFKDGRIFFGAEERIQSSNKPEVSSIRNLNVREFPDRYDLDTYKYNISGLINRGDSIPLVRTSTASREIPYTYWNGTKLWKDLEVRVWQ